MDKSSFASSYWLKIQEIEDSIIGFAALKPKYRRAKAQKAFVRGTFLKLVTITEWFIENMTIGVFSGCISVTSPWFAIKPKHLVFYTANRWDYAMFEQYLIWATGNYVDWLPSDKTLKILGKLFQAWHEEIKAVLKANGTVIHEIYTIRNFIAHESPYSLGKLTEIFNWISYGTEDPATEYLITPVFGGNKLDYYVAEIKKMLNELLTKLT